MSTELTLAAVDLGASSGRVMAARVGPQRGQALTHRVERGPDPARHGDVVVLDELGVVEAGAVVCAQAILFAGAQIGPGAIVGDQVCVRERARVGGRRGDHHHAGARVRGGAEALADRCPERHGRVREGLVPGRMRVRGALRPVAPGRRLDGHQPHVLPADLLQHRGHEVVEAHPRTPTRTPARAADVRSAQSASGAPAAQDGRPPTSPVGT